MSQVEVTIAVGNEEEPLVYVSHVQTVVVASEDTEEIVLACTKVLGSMIESVRGEAIDQLGVLVDVARGDS